MWQLISKQILSPNLKIQGAERNVESTIHMSNVKNRNTHKLLEIYCTAQQSYAKAKHAKMQKNPHELHACCFPNTNHFYWWNNFFSFVDGCISKFTCWDNSTLSLLHSPQFMITNQIAWSFKWDYLHYVCWRVVSWGVIRPIRSFWSLRISGGNIRFTELNYLITFQW